MKLLHLSDIHIGSARQETLDALAKAVLGAGPFDAAYITGDLFNTSRMSDPRVLDLATELLGSIAAATTGGRTVIVPGNHDVRRDGLLGPHSTDLLAAFAARCPNNIIHGLAAPGAASQLGGMPLDTVLVDSSYLPKGKISAGGIIDVDGLTKAVQSTTRTSPLLVAMHHHLVPTPVTDNDDLSAPSWVRKILGAIIANADHEEIFMTALGAGDALSALHGAGRPVIVLHGHKHYPTARLLSGLGADQNDVLLVSAGSAGLWERVAEENCWPSFNVVEFVGAALTVTTTYFEFDGKLPSKTVTMARLEQSGPRWTRPST